ncbi:MAG TPA: carboxypeptidase-like regulatory domain-containing protein [Thermoanaerobaculia bacterium]|nr:carboxypeptidase-like regulatory domain-containing protein [Thermoanaerobaculia bacterium]
MRRLRAIAFAAIVLIAIPAQPETSLPAAIQILGNVTNAARPVSNALVIALDLSTFDAIQTYTTSDGTFSLPPLPANIHKVIAVKRGFAPATATIVPNKRNQHVTLRLETEKQAKRRTTNQEMWEIRGSLPPDILRELDALLEAPAQIADYELPRFRGEMMSTTAVAAQSTSPAVAHTALGLQSRIGESWQLGIRGNLQRIDDPTDGQPFGTALAESNVVSMELRSSPTDAYRVASTRSFWRYADDAGGDHEAGIRAHNIEWEHGPARVQVRYFAQDNLFHANPFGSDQIEIAGESTVVSTRRNDVGVSLRVTQESVHDGSLDTLRTADVAANGTLFLVPALVIHYGMASRLGMDHHEWAPRTGAEWKLTKGTSFIASAMYKVVDKTPSNVLPTIVVWTDDVRVLPRYTYSFGFVSGKDENNRVTAIATVSENDAPLRVVFNDTFDQFWDGLYVDSGDVRRDVRVAYRRAVGKRFAIDLATTAGTATQRATTDRKKVYVTGDLQSTFMPTGTTLAVSYREIQQPRASSGSDYRSERINVRMAQSLYLPLDVKVLLGVELARSQNSPFLLDALDPEGSSTKYVGGLAVNF